MAEYPPRPPDRGGFDKAQASSGRSPDRGTNTWVAPAALRAADRQLEEEDRRHW